MSIDRALNDAIEHMAWRLFGFDGFEVLGDGAPNSFEALCARLHAGQRMAVWSGASDHTIFGPGIDGARVNYAFRAWHDWHHYKGHFPFTPWGEERACDRQCADLLRVFGDSPTVRRWCAIVRAEVIGQLHYAEAHSGQFPGNQAAFVRAYLDNPAAVNFTF